MATARRPMPTRNAAIVAALREVKAHMLARETVCVHMFASLGVINVYEARGNRRSVIVGFTWPTEVK